MFNRLFFPNIEPLGGVIFGHFGDRLGRKSMLVTTLVLMGVATFCIGLLPTYEQAGVLAPVLLVALRFVQGLGIGGEWGGAVLMAVGMFIRLRIVESPLFTQAKAAQPAPRLPILEAIRQRPRNVLLAMGARFAENASFYIFTVFVLTYTTAQLGYQLASPLAGGLAPLIATALLPVVQRQAVARGRLPRRNGARHARLGLVRGGNVSHGVG